MGENSFAFDVDVGGVRFCLGGVGWSDTGVGGVGSGMNFSGAEFCWEKFLLVDFGGGGGQGGGGLG